MRQLKPSLPLIVCVLLCLLIVAVTLGYREEASPNQGCEGELRKLQDGSAECVVGGAVVWRRP